jgi:hypothetical protein
MSSVVSRARASFTPSPGENDAEPGAAAPPEPAGPRRQGAPKAAAGIASTPWRGQAGAEPNGMPRIHPPTDDDEPRGVA